MSLPLPPVLIKRHRLLINFLFQEEIASTEELSKILKASKTTIQRDINYLSKYEIITRVRGGAKINWYNANSLLDSESRKEQWEEKLRIGREAANIVKNGDLLATNSGSTIRAFYLNLWDKDFLSIVTSDYSLARLISQKTTFDVFFTGGLTGKGYSAVLGRNSIEVFQSFVFDYCFIGTKFVSLEEGVISESFQAAEMTRALIENSKTVVLLADSTKIKREKIGFPISSLSNIDILITDSGIKKKPDLLQKIKSYKELDLIIV